MDYDYRIDGSRSPVDTLTYEVKNIMGAYVAVVGDNHRDN